MSGDFKWIPPKKFWTDDKLDWFLTFVIGSLWFHPLDKKFVWDNELKRYLAYFFNKEFNSEKSPDAVYRRFRKVHKYIHKTKSVPRMGNCREGTKKYYGVYGFKTSDI